MSIIILHKIVTYVPLVTVSTDSLPCWIWWIKLVYGESPVARNWRHPSANNKQVAEILSLTASEELNPPNHRSFPSRASDETPALAFTLIAALRETLLQQTQLSHAWTLDPRNDVIMNVGCFKPIRLW